MSSESDYLDLSGVTGELDSNFDVVVGQNLNRTGIQESRRRTGDSKFGCQREQRNGAITSRKYETRKIIFVYV